MTAYLGFGAAIVDGLLTEPLASAGYARQAAGITAAGDEVTLSAPVTFGPASASWGPLEVMAVFSAASGGTMTYSAAIGPISVAEGQILSVPPGTYAMGSGASLGSTVLTVNGLPLTFAGNPMRMA